MLEIALRFEEQHEVRIHRDDAGAPWFCAADVCAALGYANARDAVAQHVEQDDVAKRDAIDSMGRHQPTNFVNESGLYSLIFGSNLEAARRFKRWVTSEVLPSIRKTGDYSGAPRAAPRQLSARTRDVTQTCLLLAREVLGKMMGVPKDIQAAATLEMVRVNTGLEIEPMRKGLPTTTKPMAGMNATDLGKKFGVSAREVNRQLADLGFHFRNDRGEWELTETGKQYGEALAFARNGHTGYQVLWKGSVESVLRASNSDDAGGAA